MRSARLVLVLSTLAALVACGEIPPPDVEPPQPPARLAVIPTYDASLEPASAVLSFVPASATTLTVTDLDEIRARLGVPNLTSEDPMADRSDFWRRAEADAPLLAQGLLRADNSELMLDYGFTQDDVDWEAHFVGPDASGYVLALRDDLDMDAVARAVRDRVGPLDGADVLSSEHLVVSGGAESAVASLATDPAVVGLTGSGSGAAEATYVRRGCLPFDEALGPDATATDRAAVLARHDVTDLDPLAAFSLSFGDHLATVRMDRDRADLFDRLRLGEDWPKTGAPAFGDGFGASVGDPATGRIGYDVPRPAVAARLALLETLPFGVCNEVAPMAEPTGP